MQAARWGYVIGVHAVLLLLIWKTDAIEQVARRLGHREAAAIAANHRTILARLAGLPRVLAVGLHLSRGGYERLAAAIAPALAP